MEGRECCGTCKWHEHEEISDGWICVNDQSDYCGDWTEYDDGCQEWEERQEGRYEETKRGEV